jgi:hypothetical protein
LVWFEGLFFEKRMTFKCHVSLEENKSTQNQTGLRKPTALEFSTFSQGTKFSFSEKHEKEKMFPEIGRENILSKMKLHSKNCNTRK